MEIFYSTIFTRDEGYEICILSDSESQHCTKVLRHRCGDKIDVIDGKGTLFFCEIVDDNPRGVRARILDSLPSYGSHPYHLTLAVCPTKNMDRIEWFLEKATEIGVDRIIPLIGDRSERRIMKTERGEKILLSAAKQSLKGAVPVLEQPIEVREFLEQSVPSSVNLIAHCIEEGERKSIKDVLDALPDDNTRPIVVMIGPEGDFSPEEVALAEERGFVPVSLGDSRLRTESAGVFAASAVYYRFMK